MDYIPDLLPKFGRIDVVGILGLTFLFENRPLQNIRIGAGDYGYLAEMRHSISNQWSEVFISPRKLLKAAIDVEVTLPHKISGHIWFEEKDRQQAIDLFRKTIIDCLNEMQDKINITIRKTIDAPVV